MRAPSITSYTPHEVETTRTMDVLLDTRMALRGLGISTFVDRLTQGFTSYPAVSVTRWQGSGSWGLRGQVSTLTRSGLFDLSPQLDPRARRFDVVHYVSNVGPVFPGERSVLTVHDMLYRRNARLRDRVYGFLLERSLPRAARVVAVSVRTASEVALAFPTLADRIEVIPHGLRRLAPPQGERRHVLAFGGGSDPRKRSDLMVAVYRRYRETTVDPLPLVVLARAGLTAAQARDLGDLGAHIVTTATGAQVDQLMAEAAALLYPTTTEGFGLPILEAGEVGCPVVLDAKADLPPEVRGRHCVAVADTDLSSWVIALHQAIADGPVRDPLDLPDWESVAGRYVEMYREVAGE